ncbi:hypothetical protein KM043_004220 [Ampulex compressa]|nr:hypothetical protein KM043_004220 [Ampulex compressa]
MQKFESPAESSSGIIPKTGTYTRHVAGERSGRSERRLKEKSPRLRRELSLPGLRVLVGALAVEQKRLRKLWKMKRSNPEPAFAASKSKYAKRIIIGPWDKLQDSGVTVPPRF